jgi:TetR/AcrR family transcriptional regulator, ethionamide resistance regulator
MASRFDSSPTTAKRTAVQAQLLAAAHEVLDEGVAYTDLSIERITKRAGLSRTAFYFYFADKRELLLGLAEDVAAQFYDQAARWFTGDGRSADDVRDALSGIGSLYDDHGTVVRVLVEAAASDEQSSALWHMLMGRFIDATRARIERDQQAGSALPEPAGPLAFSLCWMCERAFYEHHIQPPGPSRDELVDALTAIWTRSIYG